jgi:hypothetical protein
MSISRATRMRMNGLYCLLAEQVSPQEHLLWRACPDLDCCSAARVDLYRFAPLRRVAPWRTLGASALVAVLVFFNARGGGPPTDETTINAGLAAFFAFYGTLFACMLWYRIVQLSRAGQLPWCVWCWPTVWQFLRLPDPDDTRRPGAPLVEPSATPTHRDPVVYGLTDQRVLVLVDGTRKRVHSYWLHAIKGVKCADAADGWGDLTLLVEVEETTSDSDRSEPDCVMAFEEIRLYGIGRASNVAQALRCLITQQPLSSAIAALTSEPGSPSVPGEHLWQGEGPAHATVAPARRWQATLWHGGSETHLAPSTAYGSSLAKLRGQVSEQLLTLRPQCFSNGPSPLSQHAFRLPWEQHALYLRSSLGGAAWQRETQANDSSAPHEFTRFEDAVAFFVGHDVLPEKGPAYDEDMAPVRENQWLSVHTVKVVDDETLANDLLHRGGWHIFTAMGMTDPRGTTGPVLFVLGHPEDGAV